MTERYVFEYIGATFRVDVNLDGPTTTEPPNLRTIEGSWKTWRLVVERTEEGRITALQLVRSVGEGGVEHPAGNLSSEASGPNGNHMMMIASNGYIYKIATGWGVVGHLYTSAEWAVQIAAWEASLPSNNRAE